MDNPELYLKSNQPSHVLINNLLEAHPDFLEWEENEEVIDIGCGVGEATLDCVLPILPKNFKKLIGIDASSNAISIARNRNNNLKVDFSVFDMGSKVLPESLRNEFNHVLSFYCLHWVAQQEKAFENIYNMLKPGGQAFVAFIVSSPFFVAQETLMKSEKWKSYFLNLETQLLPPYLHDNNPTKKLGKLLDQFGFLLHYSGIKETKSVFLNSTDLENFSYSLNRFIKYVPRELKDDYVKDYFSEIKKDARTTSFANEEKIEVKFTEIVLLFLKPKT